MLGPESRVIRRMSSDHDRFIRLDGPTREFALKHDYLGGWWPDAGKIALIGEMRVTRGHRIANDPA
jgi:hypothetical protein